MHIPDGFIDVKTAAMTGLLATGGLGLALHRAGKALPPKRIPLLGLSSAFVFAAQMLNFPVVGGTSGHLIGSVLVSVLLGPAASIVVLSAVLLVQCLLFADGGLTALGANVFNMALVGSVGGYLIYAGLARVGSFLTKRLTGESRSARLRVRIAAAAFASWASVVLAAIACSGELALSGTVRWYVIFPIMTQLHLLIGVGEAVITSLVLVSIASTRPDLFGPEEGGHAAWKKSDFRDLLAYGAILSIGLALFVSPFASTLPDGLDRAAEVLGFKNQAMAMVSAPLGEYHLPGVKNEGTSTALAGGVGVLVMLALSWGLARVLVPERSAGFAGERE